MNERSEERNGSCCDGNTNGHAAVGERSNLLPTAVHLSGGCNGSEFLVLRCFCRVPA